MYEPFFSGIMNSGVSYSTSKKPILRKIAHFFAACHTCSARSPGEVLISNDGATSLSSPGVAFFFEMLIQLIQNISDLPGKP
jgi:hypothetical protein